MDDNNERELQLIFDEASSLKKVQKELTDAKHTISDMTEKIQALTIENEDLRSYNRNLRSLVKILADENESSQNQNRQERQQLQHGKETHQVRKAQQRQNLISTQRKTNPKNVPSNDVPSPNAQRSKKKHILCHLEKTSSFKEIHLHPPQMNTKKNPLAKANEEKERTLSIDRQEKSADLHDDKQEKSADLHDDKQINHLLSDHKKSSVNAFSTRAIQGSTNSISRMNVPSTSLSNYARIDSSIHGSDIVDIPLDIPLEFRPETASEPISVVTEASSYGSYSREENED
jgi:hypothetical protein